MVSMVEEVLVDIPQGQDAADVVLDILDKIEDSWNTLEHGVAAVVEQKVAPADLNVDVAVLDVGPVAVAVVVELLVADATVVADYLPEMDDLPLAGVGVRADDVKPFVVKVAAGVVVGVAFVAVVDVGYYVAAAFVESMEFDFAGRRTYDAVEYAAFADEDVVIVAGATPFPQVDVTLEVERHDGVVVSALFAADSASVASYLIRLACSCR